MLDSVHWVGPRWYYLVDGRVLCFILLNAYLNAYLNVFSFTVDINSIGYCRVNMPVPLEYTGFIWNYKRL
ncbi:MAG: hypothetical protein ACI9VT_004263 [Psychroserpens sp.]